MGFGRRQFPMSWVRSVFQPVSATLLVLLLYVSLSAAVGIQHTHTHTNRHAHAHAHSHGHSRHSTSKASGLHQPPAGGDTVPDGEILSSTKHPQKKRGLSAITIARSEGTFNNSQAAVNKYVAPIIEEGEADHVREIYDDIMKYRSTLRAIEERKHQRAEIGVTKYFQHIKQELYARDHVQDLMEAAAAKCTEHLQQFFELQQQFDYHTEVARQLETNATWVLKKYALDADADPHRVSDLSSQQRVLHDHRVAKKAPTIAALEEVKDHCDEASVHNNSGNDSTRDTDGIADAEDEGQDDDARGTGDGNEGGDDKDDLDDQRSRETTPSGQRVYNSRNNDDDDDSDDADDDRDDADDDKDANSDDFDGSDDHHTKNEGAANKAKTSSDAALAVSQLQKQLVDQMAVSAQLKELVALLVKLVQTAAVPGSARPVSSRTPTLAAPPTAAASGRHTEQKCQADIRKMLLHHHVGQYVANSRLLRAVYRGFTKLAAFSEDDSELMQKHFEEEAAARSGSSSHDMCRTIQFERALEAHMKKLEAETRRGFERLGQVLPTPGPGTTSEKDDDASSVARVVQQSTRQLHHEMQRAPIDQSTPIQTLNDAISPLLNRSTSGGGSPYAVGVWSVNGGEAAAFVPQLQQFTDALQLEALRLARQFLGNASQSTATTSTNLDGTPTTEVPMSGHSDVDAAVDDNDEEDSEDSEYTTTDTPSDASHDGGEDGDIDRESLDSLAPFETTTLAAGASSGVAPTGVAVGQEADVDGDNDESPDGLAPYETTPAAGAAPGVAQSVAGVGAAIENDDDGDESPDGLAPYETTTLAAGASSGVAPTGVAVGQEADVDGDNDESPDGLAPYETTPAAGAAPGVAQSVAGVGATIENDDDGDESPDGLAPYETTTLAAGASSGVAPTGVAVGQEADVDGDNDESPDGLAPYETTAMPLPNAKMPVASVQAGIGVESAASPASPRDSGIGSHQNGMSRTVQQLAAGGAASTAQRIPTAQAARSGRSISIPDSGVVNVAAKAAAQVVAEMNPGSKRRSGKSASKRAPGLIKKKALADAAGAAAAAMAASESAPETALPRFQEQLASSSSTQSTSHRTLTNIEKLRAARARLAKTVALADP